MNIAEIQRRYNLFRDAGEDHNEFIDANFLSISQANQLEDEYKKTVDQSKTPEYLTAVERCREGLVRQAENEHEMNRVRALVDPAFGGHFSHPYLHVVPQRPTGLE